MTVYATLNGPQEIICTGSGTLGAQAVVLYPDDNATATSAYWVDTFDITDNWSTSVAVQGGALDYIDTLTFAPGRLKWIWVYIYTADGSTGTEAGDVTAYALFDKSETYTKGD